MLNFKKLKFTKKYFFVFGIVIFLLFLSSIIIYASGVWDEGYRINTETKEVKVGASEECHKITNTSSNSYFIPTKTTAEWDAFVANSPSGVTIGSCCTPHYEKKCYNDDVYWYDSCGVREEDIYDDCDSSEICYMNNCWALMAYNHIGPYGPSSNFWKGTLGSNQDFNFDGHTYNSGDLETIIRTKPFQYLKILDGNENVRLDILFSRNDTTFSEKLSTTESLTGGKWYPSKVGTYTTVSALLGKIHGNSFGDKRVTGIATYCSTWLAPYAINGMCSQKGDEKIFNVGERKHRCCDGESNYYVIIR